MHEGYGVRRVDPVAELELHDLLLAAEQLATLRHLVHRAGLEHDRRRHRFPAQRCGHLLVLDRVVRGDRHAAVRCHLEDKHLVDVLETRLLGQLGDPDRAVAAVAEGRATDSESVHVARAGSRGDADLHQAVRFLPTL